MVGKTLIHSLWSLEHVFVLKWRSFFGKLLAYFVWRDWWKKLVVLEAIQKVNQTTGHDKLIQQSQYIKSNSMKMDEHGL